MAELGWGLDGVVVATSDRTAIKAFRHQELYLREQNVYRRLSERGLVRIAEFKIPRFVNSDDTLMVVEMTTVSPPFVLDFAGAYLDRRPEYMDSPDVMEAWEQEKLEQFGEKWPTVVSVMAEFRRHGVFLTDVKPGNIMFGDEHL